MMGGELMVTSEFGSGSTFTALLPSDSRGLEDELSLEVPVKTKEAQQELTALSSEKKVLVIDDDPIVRDLMKNHLENDGLSPYTVRYHQKPP